ncbi:MAG: DUF5320 domain-containing protein [Candidatus Cloacimonetes bacterium]|nr:DUF5320 domain-containing protein [Candidatus Cloacimonadota bacterium]
MPRGDRTGPDGFGPMTGRGAGYCAGYDRPGYANPYQPRRHLRMGFRRFFGGFRRYMPEYYPYPEPVEYDEKEFLEKEIERMNGQLDAMRSRLEALENKKKEK